MCGLWAWFFGGWEGVKATADGFEEVELITDVLQRRVPFEAVVARDRVVSCWAFQEPGGKKFADEIVGDEADEDCDGKGEGPEKEGDGPLCAIKTHGR
jgi:hypothetical protein